MRRTILYHSQEELASLSFLEGERALIITPSPTLADSCQNLLRSEKRVSEVITFSTFLQRELSLTLGDRVHLFKRKSDLLIYLATIWKRLFPNYPEALFFQAFELFTELRSYSLKAEILDEVLEHFDSRMAIVVKSFLTVVEGTGVLDEHAAIFGLAEHYRKLEDDPEVRSNRDSLSLIFWGFKTVTAAQVDLIKAMSIQHDLFVLYPAGLYHLSSDRDWISWLCDEKKVLTSSKRRDSINVAFFQKNRLAQFLKTKMLTPQILLMKKGATLRDYQEIPVADYRFQSEVDLFQASLKELYERFKEAIEQQELLLESEIIKLGNAEYEAIIKVKPRDWRRLKALTLFKESYMLWREQSEMNSALTRFDLSIVFEFAKLRLPRVKAFASAHSYQGEIFDLTQFDSVKVEHPIIILVQGAYPKLRQSSNRYPDGVMEILSSVAPMRTKETEILQLKEQLFECLSKPHATLLLEQGIEDHDPFWGEFLRSFDHIKIEQDEEKFAVSRSDFLEKQVYLNKEISLSPSKIQKYLDCPRSFYYDFIEKKNLKVTLPSQFDPSILGALEHEVIEHYFKGSVPASYDEERFVSVAASIFEKKINGAEIMISDADLYSYKNEILRYGRRGVQFIHHLLRVMPGAVLRFEVPYRNAELGMTGKCDALLDDGRTLCLVDFKRSAGGVPKKNDFFELKKIQLWNYLLHFRNFSKKDVFAGYLALGEIEKSFFITSDKALPVVTAIEEDQKEIRIHQVDEFDTRLKEYEEMESELIVKIRSDDRFLAVPLYKAACTYCPVSVLCQKGESDEQENA